MTNEEKYSNLRAELLEMIESGNITTGVLGLSQNSFEFLVEFDLEEYKKKIIKIIQIHLDYCEKQNGNPYCKNCGLSEETISKLK